MCMIGRQLKRKPIKDQTIIAYKAIQNTGRSVVAPYKYKMDRTNYAPMALRWRFIENGRYAFSGFWSWSSLRTAKSFYSGRHFYIYKVRLSGLIMPHAQGYRSSEVRILRRVQ